MKKLLETLNSFGLKIDCDRFKRSNKNHYILYGDVIIDDEITTSDFFIGSRYQAKKLLKRMLKSYI